MNIKWGYGILIGIGIIAAAYSVTQSNMNAGILSIIGVFTFTNALRSQAFHDRKMYGEAKLMKWFSILFGALFVGFLIVTLVKS